MSNHRAAAEALLTAAGDIGEYIQNAADGIRSADMYTALQSAGVAGSAATAHALLAVEARLGELVEQQRLATALEALSHPGVVENLDEHRAARARVRRLLGLNDTPEGA